VARLPSQATVPTLTLTFDTVSTEESFLALGGEWDRLVRAMPRPSPALLHGWLLEWWRHYGDDAELAVQIAQREGRLVGALPVCIRRRMGLRVLTFIGGDHCPLADLLLADGESAATAAALTERAASTRPDFADLFGVPADGRLTQQLSGSAHAIERAEAPVLDLDAGWPAVYQAKTSRNTRNLHRRRRKQLAVLGRVEVAVARTADELQLALEDAFALHALRWHGRPDGSRFITPTGKRFQRAGLRALAEIDVPRIVTLKLDGRPIAFHYYFFLERRMYVHRLAFDPALGRFSPGLINTLDTLAVAAAEGATRVEFLGGAERYKLELADRLEPLYQLVGLQGTLQGAAAVAIRTRAIQLRKLLKRSTALHSFYRDGLAPARRLVTRIRRR
jgi:CelD/BcsL family acetyltransferase involved in cellulose biosynthesis